VRGEEEGILREHKLGGKGSTKTRPDSFKRGGEVGTGRLYGMSPIIHSRVITLVVSTSAGGDHVISGKNEWRERHWNYPMDSSPIIFATADTGTLTLSGGGWAAVPRPQQRNRKPAPGNKATSPMKPTTRRGNGG